MEKMNKHLQRVIGEILLEEADIPLNTLVTISRVETTYNLASANVFLYIFPTEKAEEMAEHLRKQLYELQGFLNRTLDSRVVPRIRFSVDYGADHAAKIEQRILELKRSEPGPAGEADNHS